MDLILYVHHGKNKNYIVCFTKIRNIIVFETATILSIGSNSYKLFKCFCIVDRLTILFLPGKGRKNDKNSNNHWYDRKVSYERHWCLLSSLA